MARRGSSTIKSPRTIKRPRKSMRASRGEAVLISRTVLCSVGGISERQLAVWEREDLIAPACIAQIGGREEPLYEPSAVHRVRVIRTLAEELEVNLPGIDVILHLLDQMGR
jgi:DNA-binding transcriptional MerR regulator